MAVRKRGNKWVADVPLFGRNGKRIRRTFPTRTLAITFERTLKLQEAKGELDIIKPEPILLGKFIEKYFELHESGNRASTGKRDIYVLRRFIEFMGDIHVTRISRERMEQYKAHRQQQVKPATVNLELRSS